MIWGIIGILILSLFYNLYQRGVQREKEAKKALERKEIGDKLTRELESIQTEYKKRADAEAVVKAQENWDKYVKEKNISQYLTNIVTHNKSYQYYIWKDHDRLYFFIPRPSLSNASFLGESLTNLAYPENISKKHLFIQISDINDLYRRDGCTHLIVNNSDWIFDLKDYDLLYRLKND